MDLDHSASKTFGSQHQPSTFEERGTTVPFTTPALSCARVRSDDRYNLVLLTPGFAGTQSVYVLPWKAIPDLVTMTIHDRALHEAIEREGIDAPPDVRAPHGRRVVKMSAWTEELIRTMPGDDRGSDKFKDRVRKARDVASVKMRNRGIIGMDQDFVWRTSKRVAMIDRAENSEQTAARSEIVEQNSSGRTFSSEIDF